MKGDKSNVNSAEDLSNIKEYYDDCKSLLMKQKLCELEELLKGYQSQANDHL